MIGMRKRGTADGGQGAGTCPDCGRRLTECVCPDKYRCALCPAQSNGPVPYALVAGTALWALRRRSGDVVDAGARVLFAALSTALVYVLYLAVTR